MIAVTKNLSLDESELEFEYVMASGPGGQNVNRTASAVQLRFHVLSSASLPAPVKERLRAQQSNRINEQGELVIEAKRFRSQHRNREDAIDRLVKMLQHAATPPKRRKPTKPSVSSKRKRLDRKKQHGEKKKRRNPPDW